MTSNVHDVRVYAKPDSAPTIAGSCSFRASDLICPPCSLAVTPLTMSPGPIIFRQFFIGCVVQPYSSGMSVPDNFHDGFRFKNCTQRGESAFGHLVCR
jgi:hypothetical protein